MYMWREFDIGEVRDEMAQIASLGFDVVRVFTLAQDFLPQPLTVAADMVANLVEVARAAKDAGLKVVPTLVVINMSGKFWWPAWMLDAQGRPGDLFSDPTILRTQSMLVETCARALSGGRLDTRVRSGKRDRRCPAASYERCRLALGVAIGEHGKTRGSRYADSDRRAPSVTDDGELHARGRYRRGRRRGPDARLPALLQRRALISRSRAGALLLRADGRALGARPCSAHAGVRAVHRSPGSCRTHDHRRFPGTAAPSISGVRGRGGGVLRRGAGKIGEHRRGWRIRLVLRRLRLPALRSATIGDRGTGTHLRTGALGREREARSRGVPEFQEASRCRRALWFRSGDGSAPSAGRDRRRILPRAWEALRANLYAQWVEHEHS